ncbi:MAG: hypothetical protein V1773_07260 [bacterium]
MNKLNLKSKNNIFHKKLNFTKNSNYLPNGKIRFLKSFGHYLMYNSFQFAKGIIKQDYVYRNKFVNYEWNTDYTD